MTRQCIRLIFTFYTESTRFIRFRGESRFWVLMCGFWRNKRGFVSGFLRLLESVRSGGDRGVCVVPSSQTHTLHFPVQNVPESWKIFHLKMSAGAGSMGAIDWGGGGDVGNSDAVSLRRLFPVWVQPVCFVASTTNSLQLIKIFSTCLSFRLGALFVKNSFLWATPLFVRNCRWWELFCLTFNKSTILIVKNSRWWGPFCSYIHESNSPRDIYLCSQDILHVAVYSLPASTHSHV